MRKVLAWTSALMEVELAAAEEEVVSEDEAGVVEDEDELASQPKRSREDKDKVRSNLAFFMK